MRLISLLGTNMDLTDAIKKYVDDRIRTFEKFTANFEPDVELRVEVGKTTNHHSKGPFFRAEMQLAVHGDSFRAEKTAEDLYAAIDAARDDLKRQLHDHKERLSDKTKRIVRPGKE